MHASLLGCNFESYVIDNDTLGAVQRTVRGIEVNEDTLSFDVIKNVVAGEGHFLGQEQTMERMERDYFYPLVGDRLSPQDWVDAGETDVRERARAVVRRTLAEHYPSHIDPAIDFKIRENFKIVLPREAMKPGNGRW